MASNRSSEARREETERYRLAAEETLEQLDWCINYFYRTRKPHIAESLERNRSVIRRALDRARTP